MIRDLSSAFSGLFTERRSRAAVLALLLAMATIPVAELAVIRTFSQLVIDGPALYAADRAAAVRKTVVFFAGFGVTRALHHGVRFWRVRVFRKGFESSGLQRSHGEASWEWAQGFELSIICVAVIQVATLSALFFWLDAWVGAANVLACAGALVLFSKLYSRQLAKQRVFAAEGQSARATSVSERITARIFAAEYGAAIATATMAAMLLIVLWRVLDAQLAGTDAVVLFLAVRLLYGHLSAVSPSAMRFARDSVRRELAQARATAAAQEVIADVAADGAQAKARSGASARRRSELITHMVMAGQRGETDAVGVLAARLANKGALTVKESNTIRISRTFATYASEPIDGGSARLMWWPRPFPGNFGDWLSPFVLARASSRRVLFQPPTSTGDQPHLVMIGSIGRYVRPGSIVIGTGVSTAATPVDPRAQFVSVRGPISAAAVAAAGGPSVESFGDPALLLARLLPVDRSVTNGRLALVRHHAHADLPLQLPDGMDEHSVLAASPDEITRFVRTLSTYEGVVTSAMHVMIACHSYGIPCALVTFAGHLDAVAGDAVKYRDYSLGAGLDDVWEPEPIGLNVASIEWDGRLRTARVPEGTLDGIEKAIAAGIATYDLVSLDDEDEDEDDDPDDA